MDEMEKMFEEQNKANDLFIKLKETQSMSEVSDIVESMDENMAKLVLKKFIYSRGQ
jgi:hypothetical protein